MQIDQNQKSILDDERLKISLIGSTITLGSSIQNSKIFEKIKSPFNMSNHNIEDTESDLNFSQDNISYIDSKCALNRINDQINSKPLDNNNKKDIDQANKSAVQQTHDTSSLKFQMKYNNIDNMDDKTSQKSIYSTERFCESNAINTEHAQLMFQRMVPLKLKELETCLERSNQNITLLKESLNFVLEREKHVIDELNHLRETHISLIKKVNDKDNELNTLKNENNDLIKTIKTLEVSLKRSETIFNELNERLDLNEQENKNINEMKNTLEDIEMKLKVIEKERDYLSEELNNFKLKEDGYLNDKAVLDKAVNEKKQEINELKYAICDIASHTTNNEIRDRLISLKLTTNIDSYSIPYIRETVKSIKDYSDLLRVKNKNQVDILQELNHEKNLYSKLYKRFQNELIKRRMIHNKLEEIKGNIRVFCRVRPFLEKERIQKQLIDQLITFPDACTLRAFDQQSKKEFRFEFNRVFNPMEDQQYVFDDIEPLLISSLDGYNVCIMAYGQTGSGKTYTMEGNIETSGIIQMSLNYIFNQINERSEDCEINLSLSILEIYNEQIRDLLLPANNHSNSKIEIRESNGNQIYYPRINIFPIITVQEAIEHIRKGRANRAVGITNMNEYSSRSHCIYTININCKNNTLGIETNSKLNFVDLAGSERIFKSKSEGERMKEACHINQSLTTLGKVLNAISAKNPHIPYRESKLTHILKESLGGNSKCLFILQISPSSNDIDESLSTLNFGSRLAKVEKGKSTINLINHNSSVVSSAGISMIISPKPMNNITTECFSDNLRSINTSAQYININSYQPETIINTPNETYISQSRGSSFDIFTAELKNDKGIQMNKTNKKNGISEIKSPKVPLGKDKSKFERQNNITRTNSSISLYAENKENIEVNISPKLNITNQKLSTKRLSNSNEVDDNYGLSKPRNNISIECTKIDMASTIESLNQLLTKTNITLKKKPDI